MLGFQVIIERVQFFLSESNCSVHKGRPVVLLLAHLVSKGQNPKAWEGLSLASSWYLY